MNLKLTKPQKELLEILSQYTGENNPVPYDTLKDLCKFRSFDLTFNALLSKGYVERHETLDFSNQFKLV